MANREAIGILQANVIYACEKAGLSKAAIMSVEDALNQAISALEKQEQDRWIPVTERLPEEDKGLLVTDEYGEIRHAVYIDWLGKVEFKTVEESITLDDVKAWRPLPEPYTEEEA